MKIEKNELKKQIEKYVKISFGKDITEANEFEIYRALGQSIMEEIAEDLSLIHIFLLWHLELKLPF